MTGRYLRIPDDSVPVAVKVAGHLLPERPYALVDHTVREQWWPCHGGWLFLLAEEPNGHVRVKLKSGEVLEFGDA